MEQFSQFFSHLWENYTWLVHACGLFLAMLVFHLFSRKVHNLLLSRFDNGRHVWLVSFIKSVHVPWLAFFWVFTISFMIPIIMLHYDIDITHIGVMNKVRSLVFMGAIYWSLMKFITMMEEEIAPRWSRLPVRDKTSVRAVAQLSRVAVTILMILLVLPMLGVHVGSMLALGGVGGLTLGLAAKDTFANFLGGMMIFWDRPFSVGDWVRSPDRNIEGTVEYIGWRLTRIRTFSKRPLYVPNSVFSTISIENPSRMSNRQINTEIGLRYDDALQIAPIVEDIKEMLHSHPDIDHMQTTMVHFVSFGASSLNLNIYAFTKTVDWAKYRGVQQDVFLKSIGIIAKHGAECAFPTTTLQVPNPVAVTANLGAEKNDER